MLNLQFAETMELTEAELETVYGGEEHPPNRLYWNRCPMAKLL